MPLRRRLPTLALVSLLSISHVSLADTTPSDAGIVLAGDAPNASVSLDAGSGSAVATPAVAADRGSAAPAPASGSASELRADPQSKESLLKAAYKAITTKDWFLLAGVGLAGIAMLANWALEKKWRIFGNSKVRWATVGVLAGVGGLVHAWLAKVPIASSMTFIGALKVFAAAVFAYVSAKKLTEPSGSTVT